MSSPPPPSSQPSPTVTTPLAAPLAPSQYPPLPPCPPLSDSPVSSHTRSQTAPNLPPAPLLPLHQVAGPEGVTHLHVPFSPCPYRTVARLLLGQPLQLHQKLYPAVSVLRPHLARSICHPGVHHYPRGKKDHLDHSKSGSRPETPSQPSRPSPATQSGCYSRRRPRLRLSGGTEKRSQHSIHGKMPIGGNRNHLPQGGKPT